MKSTFKASSCCLPERYKEKYIMSQMFIYYLHFLGKVQYSTNAVQAVVVSEIVLDTSNFHP